MKTYLLKTESGIALEIDGVVSDCKIHILFIPTKDFYDFYFSDSGIVECTVEMEIVENWSEIGGAFASNEIKIRPNNTIRVLTINT